MAARGFVVKGRAPQVEILGHAAVGWFVTHCGWNSVIEVVVAGAALLTWPLGADQFIDAQLLEEVGMAVRVAEGRATASEAQELSRILAAVVSGRSNREILSDIQSWGFVVNTFSDLKGDYIKHLMKDVAEQFSKS